MIRMYRDDEYALHLEFELSGAKELKEMFEKSFKEGTGVLRISDSFLEENKPIHVFKVTNQGDPSELTYNNGEFKLELHPDIIEFCIIRFNECETKGDFFPAEICDVDYGDIELSIYGIFKGE